MRLSTVLMFPVALLVLAVDGPARAGEPENWNPPAPVVAAEESVAAVMGPEPAPVVAVMGPEAAAVKATRRKVKRGGKSKAGRRLTAKEREAEQRLQAAAAIRAEVLAVADEMVRAGRPGTAAAALGAAAEAYADPVLHLAAIEAELAEPKLSAERVRGALARAATVRRLVEHPAEPRVAASEGPALLEQSDALVAYGERRLAGLKLGRRGRAQVIGGTVLLTASLGGVAALASGAVLGARIDSAVASYTGSDAGYLAALGSAREQANVRMAVGAVVGLVGAAAGIPLNISGASDLRAAREAHKERPTFRVAPGLAALSFTGQF